MKRKSMVLGLLLTLVLSLITPLYADNYSSINDVFPDPNVALAVASALGKNPNDEVDPAEYTYVNFLDINGDVSTLDGLDSLTNLGFLTFRDSNVTDLSILNQLPRLRTLEIINNKETPNDFSSLWLLSQLTIEGDIGIDTLYLPGNLFGLNLINTDVKTFVPFGFDFKSLTLMGMGDLDYNALQNLHTLEYLHVDDASLDMLDVSLPNLNNLVISGEMASLDSVIQHQNLDSLTLSNTGINNKEEFEKLNNLTNLSTINLSFNQLTDESGIVEIVSNHPTISKVYLNNNALSDFSAAEAMLQKSGVYFDASGQKLESTYNGSSDTYTRAIDFIVPDAIRQMSNVTVSPQMGGIYDDSTNSITWSNLSYPTNLRYSFMSLYYGPSSYIIEGTSITDFKRSYNVQFESNGGSRVEPLQNIEIYTGIEKPADPVRPGYIFEGWYHDNDLTWPWSFEYDVVFGDTTLYAKWSPVSLSVQYDSMGGSSVDSVHDLSYQSKLTKPIEPVREGYVFNGWYKDTSLTQSWNFDQDVIVEDLTLYAKWTPLTHTIVFESHGGSFVQSLEGVEHNTKIVAPTAPTRPGFQFNGWYLIEGGADLWDFNYDVVLQDTTLHARWIPQTFIVSFDTNGGSSIDSVHDLSYQSKLTMPAQPIREGYTFNGWYKDASLNELWNFERDVIVEDLTLYAKWTPLTFTVSFDSMGGSNIDTVLEVSYGMKLVRPKDPTRVSYTFVGWYRDEQYLIPWNFDQDVVVGNLKLYAKWSKVSKPVDPKPEKPEPETPNPKPPVEVDKEKPNVLPVTGYQDFNRSLGFMFSVLGYGIIILYQVLNRKRKG